MKEYRLPLCDQDIENLKSGDIITVSGIIYTARDAAHARLVECIEKGEKTPIELNGAAIYYCGPTPALDGEIIGSCGPTTSARMDDYAPVLIEKGAKIMIGKGKRNQTVLNAIKKYKGVYFAAVGGAGALMKSFVTACRPVAYEDLGCEAIYRLEVENMQLIVACDSQGNSFLK